MSYDDGWSAFNLEMPARIPRSEYSAESHWELVSRVTGINVSQTSSGAEKERAQTAFVGPGGWNYDFVWSTLIGGDRLGSFRTDMGHAVYASGGVDFHHGDSSWCTSPEDVLKFDPEHQLPHYDHNELVRDFQTHYARQREKRPSAVAMTGIYITLISGLLDMFGWDNLLTAAGIDARQFGRVADSYARWAQQFFNAMADSNAPVIMVHDDITWTSGPFISPAWYREFVFRHYADYLRPLRDAGKKILFTSDGDYTLFVDDIAGAGVNGFVMEPMTDMAYVAREYGKTHVIVGNADTRILLNGTRDQIRLEVARCMNIGRDCPGYFMAVGNHIPSNTPVENALYYNEVYTELSRR